jgi:hypothetical protein
MNIQVYQVSETHFKGVGYVYLNASSTCANFISASVPLFQVTRDPRKTIGAPIRTGCRFDYRNLDLYLCPTGMSLQDLEVLSAIYASVDNAPRQTLRLIQ